MADTTTPEPTPIGGLDDQHNEEFRFGRCPSCSFIVEEAYDYDSQGNEVFRCERCGLSFAQDKHGAYVIIVDGSPLI